MHEIALFGAGKIGEAITALLSSSGRYKIRVCDISLERANEVAGAFQNTSAHHLKLEDAASTRSVLQGCKAIVSALPFFCNRHVVPLARTLDIHYLDLTEDTESSNFVRDASKGATSCFIPQCGLAPGYIGIAAHHLVKQFDTVDSVKLRVGALPLFPTNRLKYNLTWSTEGLINEYINPCEILLNGKKETVQAMEGYERLVVNDIEYEAFYTSGGAGSLASTLSGKVKSLNYKSLRYPGHQEYMMFLLEDLKLQHSREQLKELMESNIPGTREDKCVIFVEVIGNIGKRLMQKTYASVVYHGMLAGKHFGAIQLTTASGICTPLDLLLTGKLGPQTGLIKAEEISLVDFLKNEFGWFYRDERAMAAL